MCARGGECARGVESVLAGGEWYARAWLVCAPGGECARGVGNVLVGRAMFTRGGQCARRVGSVRAGGEGARGLVSVRAR